MKLQISIRANLGALVAWALLTFWCSMVGIEKANAMLHAYPLKAIAWCIFVAFLASLLWLYVQSWIMLGRE